MLTKKPEHIVGFVRATPRHSMQEQQRLMVLHAVFRVYDDIDLCIRQRRKNHGDVVAVTRLLVLADPRRRTTKGGIRQSLIDTVNAIEAAGATIMELETERRRDNPEHREPMLIDAINELSRTRKGTNKIGRPRRVWTDEQLTAMKAIWFDHRILTNIIAAEKIREAGVKATVAQIQKLLGPSQRVAGNPKVRHHKDGFKRRSGVVYFIQSGGERGPVKIGTAVNLGSRLSSLQTSHHKKLVVLGTIPGDARTEAEQHERFRKYHLTGEWFRCAGSLADFVKTLKKT